MSLPVLTEVLITNMAIELGVDIGGTFTDVVASDEYGRMWSAKVPTTPANLVDSIFQS